MIIDKEQLIALLIEKTGLEPDQVEEQLSKLVTRIQKAASEGKTFEIEGFGTFQMLDDELHFEPNETLETEINNKYAGMKPIELIGAFKQPEGDEVPEVPEDSMPEGSDDEDDKWALDESAFEQEPEEQPVGASSADQEFEEDETDDGRDEKDQSPVEEFEQEEDTFGKNEAEEAYKKIFGALPEQEKKTERLREEVAQSKELATVNKNDEPEEAGKDTIGRVLVAAVVVLALGVGGWLVYDTVVLNSNSAEPQKVVSNQQTSSQERVPAQQASDKPKETKQDSPSQTPATDKGSEPDEDMKVTTPKGGNSSGAEEIPSSYGLHGTVNNSIGGYTIVVHSLRSIRKAENNRKSLEALGYRSLINEADIGGTIYYRVGIGQFESVDDAQRAINQLPKRYKDNNFIKRIK